MAGQILNDFQPETPSNLSVEIKHQSSKARSFAVKEHRNTTTRSPVLEEPKPGTPTPGCIFFPWVNMDIC